MPEMDIFGEQTITKHVGEEDKQEKKVNSGAKITKLLYGFLVFNLLNASTTHLFIF